MGFLRFPATPRSEEVQETALPLGFLFLWAIGLRFWGGCPRDLGIPTASLLQYKLMAGISWEQPLPAASYRGPWGCERPFSVISGKIPVISSELKAQSLMKLDPCP